MRPAPTSCVACGSEYANHSLLWFESTSDIFALRLPIHRVPFYKPLARLVEGLASLLGRAAFHLGRALGFITLTKDLETAVSRRSRLLWEEGIRRGIQVEHLLFFGKPTDTFRVRTDSGSCFFKSLPLPPAADALRMDDKVLFKELLAEAGLPVPQSYGVSNMRQARRALDELGVVCVKPRTGSNGRHTYPHVSNDEELASALRSVKEICAFASVEEHLEGNLCRATCVDGRLIGFLESAYPTVVGDGISTIRELVERSNGIKPEGLTDIVIGEAYAGYIRRRGYGPDDVLPEGVSLPLSYRGGVAAGGSNREHGRAIDPSFIAPIEKAARLTELPIVGFDLIIPDPLVPADAQRWGFIEANSLPWIDLHAAPYYGIPIDLSPAVWELWEAQNPVRGTR